MLVSGMVVTEVDQESGKTIPGALRLSTNGTESRQASFRLDGTNHTDSYFQQNQPFPFPDALAGILDSDEQLQRGAGRQRRRGRQRRDALWDEQLPWRHVHLRARPHVQLEELLPAERDFLKRKQYGGYAGGPIISNKLFYFAGWQGTTIQNVGGTLNQTSADGGDARGRFQRHLDAAASIRTAVLPEQPDSAFAGSIRRR